MYCAYQLSGTVYVTFKFTLRPPGLRGRAKKQLFRSISPLQKHGRIDVRNVSDAEFYKLNAHVRHAFPIFRLH
jgi:hypothetical protein